MTRKAMKTTPTIGSSAAKTGGAAARGWVESTDRVSSCDIQVRQTIGHLSSGCSRDRAAPVVILRKRCALLTGISHAALKLKECARSGDQPWADRVIAKAFLPASSFISSLQRVDCWQAQNST